MRSSIASAVCCALIALSSGVARGFVWTSNGPRGGIVRSLAVDPTNPSTVYAGTSSGGVFKSTNGGGSWSFSSMGIQTSGDYIITGLAVDPATPTRVYATATSGADGGIFRSTDGGATWTFAHVGYSTAIAIDPATPTTLYAAGASDVRKSIDAGVTWTPVQIGNTTSVAINPTTPSIVYVGSYGYILKTTNGGTTWSNVAGSGLPASDTPIFVAIDPATPTTIWAGTSHGVFKSIDSGATWAGLLSGLDTQTIVVDPSDPDVVYAGGIGADDATVYKTIDGGATWTPSALEEVPNVLAVLGPTTLLAGTYDVGIFKTTDAAATWAPSNTGLVATAALSVATKPGQAGKAYAGTWSHVARTENGGSSWTTTAPFVTQGVSSVAFGTTPGVAYAGDASAYGVYQTIDDGATWSSVSFNNMAPTNAYSLAVFPGSDNDVYAGGIFPVGVAVGIFGPGAWTSINQGLFPSVRTLVMDRTNPAVLYAGTEPFDGPIQGVFKTVDGGAQWNPVNTGLPVGTIGIAVVGLALDPTNSAVVYAAVEHTGIFKTTNGGGSWTAMNGGLGSLDVTSVAVDAVVANRVYASTFDQGVFRTDDGGATWVAMNDGLVTPVIRTLAVEPGRVYAGTGANGVFVTAVDVTTTTTTSTSTTSTSTTLPPALLGRALTVRDPQPGVDPSKRKIVVSAKEPAADETLNPFALLESGGSLTLETFGATPSAQTWRLSPPLWTLVGTTGARYDDKLGVNGPVKSVVVRKSATGTFELKATILGKLGPGLQPHVFVVPPNPGVGAKMVFQVNGGDAYCTGFGGAAGGQVSNVGATAFKVTRPTAAVCP